MTFHFFEYIIKRLIIVFVGSMVNIIIATVTRTINPDPMIKLIANIMVDASMYIFTCSAVVMITVMMINIIQMIRGKIT